MPWEDKEKGVMYMSRKEMSVKGAVSDFETLGWVVKLAPPHPLKAALVRAKESVFTHVSTLPLRF